MLPSAAAELRSERKRVAEKDRDVARLKLELASSNGVTGAALDRQRELERLIEVLEANVEDSRLRGPRALEATEKDQAEREEIDRQRAATSRPRR